MNIDVGMWVCNCACVNNAWVCDVAGFQAPACAFEVSTGSTSDAEISLGRCLTQDYDSVDASLKGKPWLYSLPGSP